MSSGSYEGSEFNNISNEDNEVATQSDNWKHISDIFMNIRPRPIPHFARNYSHVNPAIGNSYLAHWCCNTTSCRKG